MSRCPSHQITALLNDWASGNTSALDRLMPLLYRELHERAKRYIGQQNHWDTLQTTEVVHEAFIKVAGNSPKHWQNRDHFLAVAAKAMRQVLLDHARAVHASKRGGSIAVSQLDEDTPAIVQPAAELIALDDALTVFAKQYPRKSDAVELRYFGGLSLEETARVLKISQDTVVRDLRFAKAWLRRELQC